MRVSYYVTPRPTRDGYNLSSDRLPYPLWFRNEVHAGDFAHWHGRSHGGSVVYLDSAGYGFIETIEGGFEEAHAGPPRPSS